MHFYYIKFPAKDLMISGDVLSARLEYQMFSAGSLECADARLDKSLFQGGAKNVKTHPILKCSTILE